VDHRPDPWHRTARRSRNSRPPGVIGLPFAAGLTLTVSLLGWGVRALLDRLTRRAPIIWTVLAFLVLLASFTPMLAVGATSAAKVVLALTHVAVAAVLIAGFSRRTP
jgi:hypothetical protein